ncbi:MAG: acyl-CoA dehydratase activase, partial [Candidatus Kariarchaeaceae archaeon]
MTINSNLMYENTNKFHEHDIVDKISNASFPGLIIDHGLDQNGNSRLEKGEPILVAIECGSSTVKAVVLRENGETVFGVYRPHRAKVYQESAYLLEQVLTIFENQVVVNVGFSGSSGQAIAKKIHEFIDMKLEDIYGPIEKDNEVNIQYTSEVTAQTAPIIAKYGHEGNISILEIGGEDSKFVSINNKGAITKVMLNGECAAGTGTFLEEQVPRIGYDGLLEMLEAAWSAVQNNVKPKNIAARCTVFAKSDITHQLRHENLPPSEVALSLVHAVARTYVFNLLGAMQKAIASKGPIIFQGGTAKNKVLVEAFRELLRKNKLDPERLIIPDFPELKIAEGAAIFADGGTDGKRINREALDYGLRELKRFISSRKVLSHYDKLGQFLENPEQFKKTWKPYKFKESEVLDVFMGLDVGSTTTKIILLDAKELKVLYRVYVRTDGQPFEVMDKHLKIIGEEIGKNIKIIHVGITGSGREAMGAIVGADVVVDEINAHAFGVGHYYDGRLSVFEIGGQDSKYIEVYNGIVNDFAMNKVCAAGTGSFFDEIADERLKIPVTRLGEMGLRSESPANLGQTCTVFMKSAIVRSQANGYNEDDIAAGLAYAIANNYLNKVKENRKVFPKIIFQGGVANNLAVVAAFKAITGSEITVPEQADVMGAVGAALIAREEYFKKNGIPSNQIRGKEIIALNGENHNDIQVSKQNKSSSSYDQRDLIFLPVTNNDPPQKVTSLKENLSVIQEKIKERNLNKKNLIDTSIPCATDILAHPVNAGDDSMPISKFRSFDKDVSYIPSETTKGSICKACPNLCQLYYIEVPSSNGKRPEKLIYGDACDRYQKNGKNYVPRQIEDLLKDRLVLLQKEYSLAKQAEHLL